MEDLTSASPPQDLRWVLTEGSGAQIPRVMRSLARSFVVKWRHRGLTGDDLIVAGFPKSGSTWLRFVLSELLTRESPRTFADVNAISPPIGSHATAPKVIEKRGRLIKSHEKFDSRALRRPLAICIVRDPRDISISLYHYCRARVHGMEISFDSFLESFISGLVLPYGSWDSHVKSWYDAARCAPQRITVIRYEDMLVSPVKTLRTALDPIGVRFPTSLLEQAFAHNTADAMRGKEQATSSTDSVKGEKGLPAPTPFVRAATAGQWQEILTSDQESGIVSAFGAVMRLAGYSS